MLTIRGINKKNPADWSLSRVDSITKTLAKSRDKITGPIERDILLMWPAKCMDIISKHYMAVYIDKSGSGKAQYVWQTLTHTHRHGLTIMNAKYYSINYADMLMAV